MKSRSTLIAYSAALLFLVLLFIMVDSLFPGLLIFLFILCSVIGYILSRISGKTLRFTAHSADPIRRGNDFLYRFEIINDSKLPVLSATLPLVIKNLLTGESQQENIRFSTGNGKEHFLKIPYHAAHTGCLELSAASVRIEEPFGIFTKTRKVNFSMRRYVFPNEGSYELSHNQIYQYDMESYKYSQDKSGSDTSETFDVREYERGDNIKSIHWKLTAKSGDVMIREPSFPIENRVMVILDKNHSLSADMTDKFMDTLIAICKNLVSRNIIHTIGWSDQTAGRFIIKDISDTESLKNALMETMTSPFTYSAHSSIYDLIYSDYELSWSNYIYLSCDDRDRERLRAYGEVTVIDPVKMA